MRISDWSSDVCSSDLNAIAADIVINGLAILCRDCSGRPVYYDLEEAYRRDIIGGPAAFVITADDMASFATAVRKKLLLQIADEMDQEDQRLEPVDPRPVPVPQRRHVARYLPGDGIPPRPFRPIGRAQ